MPCTVQGGIHPDMIMLAIGEEITFGRSFDEVITANGAINDLDVFVVV
jgi:hypothetical protein